jgi:N-glycosylase/DNA lyase
LTQRQELITNRVLVVVIGSIALLTVILIPGLEEIFNSVASWPGILGFTVFSTLKWEIKDSAFYSLLLGFLSANIFAFHTGEFSASALIGIITSALTIAAFKLYTVQKDWRTSWDVKSFSIPAEDFDLELTMTCGQTFCWHRTQGELYGEGSSKFYTFREGKALIVEQNGSELEVETELSRKDVEKALGLHHDLDEVFGRFPEDKRLDKARKELWGLRIVQDEFFPCLISYLCSPQMRIPRIKKMHNEIAREYGSVEEVNGQELLRFPTQKELSRASEDELRELGIGYRAKYIAETLKILDTEFEHEEMEEMSYNEAREYLKKLYGVGDKVADCVLLFSKGFYEAYPLDTWALKVAQKHYPEHHSDDYDEASENLRKHFGEYSGYAQEYIFHAARKGIIEV